MAYKDIIPKINDVLQPVIQLGISVILAAVIIDVLFPGNLGVVDNIGVIVAQFSSEGLAGLIALLLFLILFKRE